MKIISDYTPCMLRSYLALSFLTSLAFCFSITALSARQDSLVTLQKLFDTTDVTSTGNYNFVFCGATIPGTHSTQGHILQHIFSVFDTELKQVLIDIYLGIHSRYGYEALFKTENNRKLVKSIYQKILYRDSVTVNAERAQALGNQTAQPTFVCINPENSQTNHTLAHCNTGRIALTTRTGWETIFICPFFWYLPLGLHQDQCPKVVNNKFIGNNRLSPNTAISGTALANSMYASLIHELVHAYFRATTQKETYYLQDCVRLDAKASIENAHNYAYYASGK